ncbi:MAG: nucleotidyltransferase [Eubacterium sp.]|nr:nucleotidyltransferase [Eubacterium sp.]MCM1216931.1 nucleotidyltransferase [Lachnospiraceae bacterium]MCM1303971.1 nucleotidyltransferase [Butyrivibrio sp.]MCM1345263.1 nucleotidyltransferase [Muribaculaceae bacterium]MCM1240664.1 nucleotidyltransferase [Lachnospiraceae bacterium]
MKVNGIIAEYNPFHNGHKYQMDVSRQMTGADYTVVIMSGDFVQRGAPALLDKHRRAEMALRCGADLVLCLPAIYSSSSAEYFSMGAVSTLDRLGVVTHLSFGSECGNVEVMTKAARILVEEPEEFSATMRQYLKQGVSYPNARNWAMFLNYPFLQAYRDVFATPNNILGIEYIKALLRRGSEITPVTVLRTGAGYHDRMSDMEYCSALAIRQALYTGQTPDTMKSQMPDEAWRILQQSMEDSSIICSNDFSDLLYYKLVLEREHGYQGYLDVSDDLSDRIRNNLDYYRDYDNFCDLLKTKNMTYTRISRCLLHILLNIRQEDVEICRKLDYAPYARVLGMRKDAHELLSAIKERSSIPLVTKLADAAKYLDEDAMHMLAQDILVSHIYRSVTPHFKERSVVSEYSIPVVTL